MMDFEGSSRTNLPIESPDDAVLRMIGSAVFEPNANITLPSGYVMTNDETRVFTSLFAEETEPVLVEATRILNDEVSNYTNSPHTPINDGWTGNPELDRRIFFQRAKEERRSQKTVQKMARESKNGWLKHFLPRF